MALRMRDYSLLLIKVIKLCSFVVDAATKVFQEAAIDLERRDVGKLK